MHNSDFVCESINIVQEEHKKRHIPSASAALFIGGVLGLIQAIFLISAAKPLLNFMGVTSVSSLGLRNVTFRIIALWCLL